MAYSSKQADLLLLLFLLAAAVAAAAAAGGDGAQLDPLEDEKFFLPPPILDPARVAECWSTVLGIPDCSREILTSFVTLRFQPGPACCSVINKIEHGCFMNLFANAPFNPFFPPLLKSTCAKKTPGSPLPKLA